MSLVDLVRHKERLCSSFAEIQMPNDMVHHLLDLIWDYRDDLDDNKQTKKSVWEKIHRDMEDKFSRSKKKYTALQYCTKFKGLCRTYRERQAARKRTGGKALKGWPFEEQMHRILG